MVYRFGEKLATAALGVYQTITLAEARAKRLEIKKQIAEGINPAAERKIDKARHEGRTDVAVGKLTWLLEFAYPMIGDRKIDEIEAPELLAVLRAVQKRGRYENRTTAARHLRTGLPLCHCHGSCRPRRFGIPALSADRAQV